MKLREAAGEIDALEEAVADISDDRIQLKSLKVSKTREANLKSNAEELKAAEVRYCDVHMCLAVDQVYVGLVLQM